MNVLDVDIYEESLDGAIALGKKFLSGNKLKCVVTPNPEILYLASENRELKDALKSADLLLPDGIGIVIASKMISRKKKIENPIKNRIAGFDFLMKIFETCEKMGKTVFLLGAKEGVGKKACDKLFEQYPRLQIAGYENGYFSNEDAVVKKINRVNPDFLVVALGAPKQEIFIHKHKHELNCKMAIGVGGALDVLAGNVKRAPIVWQKMHMEWLYRAIKEPKRFKRLMVIPKFLMKVSKS